MTPTALALRGLRHYWRTNLAVVLGVAVAVSVLAGALVVGASVKASLRELAVSRLGNVDHLEAELAAKLPAARLRRPSAGFLAWLDLSALGWGEDPSVIARRKGRVALASGPAFGTQGAGHARMNIACAPETITEAVRRLAAVRP